MNYYEVCVRAALTGKSDLLQNIDIQSGWQKNDVAVIDQEISKISFFTRFEVQATGVGHAAELARDNAPRIGVSTSDKINVDIWIDKDQDISEIPLVPTFF